MVIAMALSMLLLKLRQHILTFHLSVVTLLLQKLQKLLLMQVQTALKLVSALVQSVQLVLLQVSVFHRLQQFMIQQTKQQNTVLQLSLMVVLSIQVKSLKLLLQVHLLLWLVHLLQVVKSHRVRAKSTKVVSSKFIVVWVVSLL